MLMRENHGVRHTATVVPDGFVWHEQTISAIFGGTLLRLGRFVLDRVHAPYP
jgi:hypothetical protein